MLYRVVVSFNYNEDTTLHTFKSLELFDCHDIEPYDHKVLSELLHTRLSDILEFCSLNTNAPFKTQLEAFLSEYGDSNARFFL